MSKIVLIICILLNTLIFNIIKADYFEQLKVIEKQRLDDISFTKTALEKIAKYQDDFSSEEKHLYTLLKAHSKAMLSEFSESEDLLMNILESNADADYKGRAHSILASVLQIQGRYESSYYHLDKSLSYLSKMDNKVYKTNILQNAVSFYNDSGMLDYAMEHSRRLLRHGIEGENLAEQCQAHYEMALIEHSANRVALAENRMSKAQGICLKANELIILLHLANMKAEIAMNKGDIALAEKILESNYAKVKEYGWKILTVSTENTLAELLFLKQEYKKAEEIALKALKSSEEINDIKRTKNATSVLAKIYAELDDKEEAIQYYKKYMRLEKKLSASNRKRKLAYDKARQRINSERLAKLKDTN